MKSKQPHLILSLMFCLLLVPATDTRADEYAFVTLEYPPLEYKDPSGKAKGIAVEMVSKIMTELGHQVSIEVLPWTRAVKMVRYGEADAIFTIFKNSDRETFLDYAQEVLIPQRVALYATAASPTTFNGDLETLAQLRIGVVSTISYGREFDRLRSKLRVARTGSLEQNFLKMTLGRIDLVISNVHSAENVMKRLHLEEEIRQLHPYVESVPSYIAFSKVRGLSTLKQDFDRQLRQFKRSGRYATIIGDAGLILETTKIEE